MKSKKSLARTLATLATVALPLFSAPAYADYKANIAAPSSNNIFYGTDATVKEFRVVDYNTLIKSTPEYKEIYNGKIESGTGKYWILMSQATDRIIKAINDYAKGNSIDCIAKRSSVNSFEVLPEEHQGKSRDDLLNELDITNSIVEADKKLELPKESK